MRYEINTLVGDEITTVEVAVFADDESILLAGKTAVCTTDEAVARQYAEDVFLADLRVNFPRKIAELALPIDTVEVVEDVPSVEEIPEV
ncbi:hypothetical protein [Dehalobacter restrictus]|uniref:hypothetical protein n=1 Tax=Dehalobacter restrictus TaxID=55583 RepID=UPI00338F6DB9